jgi:hypothetical protein
MFEVPLPLSATGEGFLYSSHLTRRETHLEASVKEAAKAYTVKEDENKKDSYPAGRR